MAAFIDRHCRKFAGLTEADVAGATEQRVDHWAVYQQFEALFESELERICETEGTTSAALYAEVKRLRKEDTVEGAEADIFVALVLSASEYPAFLALMKAEADDAKEERKESDDGDDESKLE